MLAAVVVLSGLSAWRQGWLTPRSSLQMVLASNPSLAPGVAVKVKGFDVGQVDRVDLGDDGKVRVRLRVATRYLPLIRKDATARLARDGFIGAAYVELGGGSPGAGLAAEGDTLAFDAGVDWNVQTAALLPQVNAIVANLKQVTSEAAEARADLRETMANLAALTRNARDGSVPLLAEAGAGTQKFAGAAADAQAMTGALKARLPGLFDDVQGIAKSARESTDAARVSVQNLNALTGTLRATLEQAQPDLVRALRNGRSASEDAAAVLSGVRGSPLYRVVAGADAASAPRLDPYDDRSSH